MGRAAVPSGASTGAHEAVELRDGDKKRYGGKGVLKAVGGGQRRDHGPAVGPRRARADQDRPRADRARRHAQQGPPRRQRDPRRRRCAVAKAAAMDGGLPLYRYVGGSQASLLPVPMMNIINGGAHADNPIDIQEFMIMPVERRSLLRGAAHGLRGVPRAAQPASRRRPQHQRRRRGRLRAEPRHGRRGAGPSS